MYTNDTSIDLEFASEKQKNDRNIVVAAIKKTPNQIRFASEHLRCDPSVIRMVVANNGNLIRHATKELLSYDLSLQFLAVQKNPESIVYLSPTMRNSFFVMKHVVFHQPEFFRVASSRLKNNHYFCMAVVEADGSTLRRMPANMKDNIDIVKVATRQKPEYIRFASKRLQTQFEQETGQVIKRKKS